MSTRLVNDVMETVVARNPGEGEFHQAAREVVESVASVIDKRPDMIIGVACERDLTSGIQDTYPIPVFGIYNKRPHGPCFNTDVDVELVEGGMRTFLEYEEEQAEEVSPEGAERAA